MRTLLFDAPEHHVLLEGDQTIHGGELFEVSNERAEELLTQPNLDVTDKPNGYREPEPEPQPEPEPVLSSLSRKQLDKLAADHGVKAPETLANKDAVIDAITQNQIQPAADDGEGPDTTPEESPEPDHEPGADVTESEKED